MKKIFFIITILFFGISNAQSKYYTKSGDVNFEASVPSFEEVKAKTNKVTAVLDIDTGKFASLILVKSFKFKVALMEEHFNENYAESTKYPKATFTGEIVNFDFDKLINKNQKYILKGDLTFHGKTVSINPDVFIKINDNHIIITSEFNIKSEEFNIDIPKVIRSKVADSVTVTINLDLIQKK